MSNLNQEKKTHGGARKGAGRPKLEVPTKYITVRLTEDEHKVFKALGGSDFVRRMINKHKKEVNFDD